MDACFPGGGAGEIQRGFAAVEKGQFDLDVGLAREFGDAEGDVPPAAGDVEHGKAVKIFAFGELDDGRGDFLGGFGSGVDAAQAVERLGMVGGGDVGAVHDFGGDVALGGEHGRVSSYRKMSGFPSFGVIRGDTAAEAAASRGKLRGWLFKELDWG